MNDDILAYYNAELEYLRDLGADFARDFPKVAGRLQLDAEKCEDPHVERLLEGFAFLAARVRKKLDDEFPEITGAMLEMLYPHYLRPLPSMTIVELLPKPGDSQLAGGPNVERGSRLDSPEVQGKPCQFRTVYPVRLWPVEVTTARLDPDRVSAPGKPPGAVAMISISLRCPAPTSFATLPLDSLRFHLAGDGSVPFSLYESLLNDTLRVIVRDPSSGASATLPPDCIRPVGLGRDEGMFPYPARSFSGYRLLQEYFALPEKFLFIDLAGLDRLRGQKFGQSLEVQVFLARPPRGEPQLGPEQFRLYCTPAINLFSITTEPISLSHSQYEYRVVPDVGRPMAVEVYSIDDVTSQGTFLEESVSYRPFYTLRHDDRADDAAYWIASRRPSTRKDDPGSEVYLTFVDRNFTPKQPATRTVTARATCSNRDLPGRLPFGGDLGDFILESAAPVSRARCLRKPTRSLRPSSRRGAHRRLISHLGLNHLSLADSEEGLDAFRELLSTYDFADSAVTRQQVRGITRVAGRRAAGRTGRAIGNAVCLGVEVSVEFDEGEYVGSGVFLFATVLERFLALSASINSFSQLVALRKGAEGVLKRWPPRAGERTLL